MVYLRPKLLFYFRLQLKQIKRLKSTRLKTWSKIIPTQSEATQFNYEIKY